MAETSDRILVSIGVSKPLGGLEQLPGAITATERMAAWGEAHGYITLLLNDETYPEITVDLLKGKISETINEVTNRTTLRRLIIFFAGHGAALGVGDQYWMLTNWYEQCNEAVKLSALQRMLEYYGPIQVSIIGDACQEFSSRFIDVIGSPILDRPNEPQKRFELDQFLAADAGKQAFMIPAEDDDEAFCLFTEVLLDALEGDAPQSFFDTSDGKKVLTSQSLARYLDASLAIEAGKYGLHMVALPRPGFYTDPVYLWLAPPQTSNGASQSGRDDAWTVKAEMSSSPAGQQRSVQKVRLRKPSGAQSTAKQQADAFRNNRDHRLRDFAKSVDSAEVRDHFETGCGICVSGAGVSEITISNGYIERLPIDDHAWFRIDLGDDADSLLWTDALVELDDGRVLTVCAINNFVAGLHVLGETDNSLFHRQIGAPEYEGTLATEMLARAHAGVLSDPELIDAAAMLRYGKHRVITLGCVVAQFYDAIRDVESLQSVASFYAKNHQPIPLDIVLYGAGQILEKGGRLYANIPATPAREPRTKVERGRSFTFDATPAIENYPIAGRVPWMRQAWSAVATANYDDSALDWRDRAIAALPSLGRGMFTIVRPEGRAALNELAGIAEAQGQAELEPAHI